MLNKAQLIGHLGRDTDLRYTPDGTAVANLAVATNENWKDKSGAKQERTEWHRVVLFGKVAEIAGEYLHKGSLVYLEGRIQTRKWQGEDGADRYTTEIVADQMRMLGGRKGQEMGASTDTGSSPEAGAPDEDVPF